MRQLTLELDDETEARIEADARRRNISFEKAAADHFHRLAYEAKHGPISDEDFADIDAGLAEAERGEFATDEEVAAIFRKYGV